MADSLFDLLGSKNFDEPTEATIIKRFVQEKYQKTVSVTVREKDIIIAASSASFANALRMQTTQLQRAVGTQKRLIFRIG